MATLLPNPLSMQGLRSIAGSGRSARGGRVATWICALIRLTNSEHGGLPEVMGRGRLGRLVKWYALKGVKS